MGWSTANQAKGCDVFVHFVVIFVVIFVIIAVPDFLVVIHFVDFKAKPAVFVNAGSYVGHQLHDGGSQAGDNYFSSDSYD